MPVCHIGYRFQACWFLTFLLHTGMILSFPLLLLAPNYSPLRKSNPAMLYFKPNTTGGTSYHFGLLDSCKYTNGEPSCKTPNNPFVPNWDSGSDFYINRIMTPDKILVGALALFEISGGMSFLSWPFTLVATYGACRRFRMSPSKRAKEPAYLGPPCGPYLNKVNGYMNIANMVLGLIATTAFVTSLSTTKSGLDPLVDPAGDVTQTREYDFEVLTGGAFGFLWARDGLQIAIAIFTSHVSFNVDFSSPPSYEESQKAAKPATLLLMTEKGSVGRLHLPGEENPLA